MSSAYANLLQHLQSNRAEKRVSYEHLVESIGYYLCEPPVHTRSPTALAAAVVNSPAWHPLALEIGSKLRDAFASATLYKAKKLEEDGGGGLFSRGTEQSMTTWINEVEEGMRVGPPSVQAICLGGVLRGLKSGHEKKTSSQTVLRLQKRLMETLALIYHPTSASSSWETDFQAKAQESEFDIIPIIVSAEHLQKLSYGSLRHLGVEALIFRLLDSLYLLLAQSDGRSFLQAAKSTCFTVNGGIKALVPDNLFLNAINRITSAPSFVTAAPISKLLAHLITLHSGGRPILTWATCNRILERLEVTCTALAEDWFAGQLYLSQQDNQMDSQMQDAMTTVWSILKTTLFVNIMLTQSIFSAYTCTTPPDQATLSVNEFLPHLAVRILNIHVKLAFVISQFGGISPSSGAGFTELKRVVYTALDILASSPTHAECFIHDCSAGMTISPDSPISRTQYPRLTFTLACAEQLMPVLPEQFVIAHLIPLCVPYFGSPDPRDLFECSHSVMLSIFAAASPQGEQVNTGKGDRWSGFTRRIVPFYLNSLLENSREGHLNTEQLRLAFATLTRAAGQLSSTTTQTGDLPRNSLTWYIVDSIQQLVTACAEDRARSQRLRLALVSTISGLERAMLQHTLPIIGSLIDELPRDGSDREELVNALYAVLLNDVADAHKQFVMDWWHIYRGRWEVDSGDHVAQL